MLVALVPDLAVETTGAWILGLGVVSFAVLNRLVLRARAQAWQRSHGQFLSRVLLVQVAVVPMLIGGAVLLSGSSSGLDWVVWGSRPPCSWGSSTRGCCSWRS